MSGTIGVLGLGALGRRLASDLSAAGFEVHAWNRGPCAEVPDVRVHASLEELARHAERWILCTTESSLADVAAKGARLEAGLLPRTALHTSGALPPDALAPLAERGASVGVLHPLIAVSGTERGLAGAAFGLRGSGSAGELAREVVERLGGEVIQIPDDDGAQVRYHAAAALVAGGAVALVERALGLLDAADPTLPSTRRALARLLESVAWNLERDEPAVALTGPLVRGEAALVGRHLAALEAADPQAAALYRLLSRLLLERCAPRLDDSTRRELRRRIDS